MRLLFSLLLLVPTLLEAATVNWTNQFSVTGYAPGDTVKLWGSNWILPLFTVTNSGTAGNPITFVWQSGCSIAYTSMIPNSAMIEFSGRHDLVFDGGSGSASPSSVALTDNGTTSANSPGTNDYGAQPLFFFNSYSTPVTNVTIQNMTMRGLFNRMGFTNGGHFDSAGIRILIGSGITISNCFAGEQDDGLCFLNYASGAQNALVIGNKITNSNHGITIATATDGASLLGVQVQKNDVQLGDMYETKDGVDVGLHRDPIFFFSEAPAPARHSLFANIDVSQNFISCGTTNAQSTTAGTAAIFWDFYHVDQVSNAMVYNNVSVIGSKLQWSGGSGFFGVAGLNSLLANNTGVSWKTNGVYGGGNNGFGFSGTNSFSFNNIIVANAGPTALNIRDVGGLTADNTTRATIFSSATNDFNIFNGQNQNSYVAVIFDTNDATWSQSILSTMNQWTNIYGGLMVTNWDHHSKTNVVTLDANYIPVVGDTVARLSGTNLTAFGITNDFKGNPRPATGNWTIGAFETTNANPSILVFPASITFATQARNASSTSTIGVTNNGGGTLSWTASTGTANYTLSPTSGSLAANVGQTVTVTFLDSTAEVSSDTATFTGGGGATVVLSGTTTNFFTTTLFGPMTIKGGNVGTAVFK